MKVEAKCELSTEQLIKELKDWSDKLAESGGEAWTLRVPVDANKDPDCLIYEACNRLEYHQSQLQALKEEVEDLQTESESCDYHDGIHDALVLIDIYKNGKET